MAAGFVYEGVEWHPPVNNFAKNGGRHLSGRKAFYGRSASGSWRDAVCQCRQEIRYPQGPRLDGRVGDVRTRG